MKGAEWRVEGGGRRVEGGGWRVDGLGGRTGRRALRSPFTLYPAPSFRIRGFGIREGLLDVDEGAPLLAPHARHLVRLVLLPLHARPFVGAS